MTNAIRTIESPRVDTTATVFFDSWGRPYETCSPDAEGAQAFGPAGASRPVEGPRETEYQRERLYEDPHGWTWLVSIP